ncbi:signal peptidase I [Amycolatopsis sp. FDAARGOS 1241]|uniref:signal peptidase I n=1 Tax=Amycolatopsis sp. FDAARGOS 1241 TaxID=2778070 RepID=UPI001951AFFE|nr:signal peptidase I [Amycolatopsis sp. FDAARGOS 1241]QRP43747.1 signal peptidase I [Amycolatopsis sp. FDAARGOS 1241]
MTDFPAPPAAQPRKRRFSPLLALFVVFVVAGAALAATGVAKVLGYGMVTVHGASMGTTIRSGDSVVFDWAARSEIHRGDLVVFQADALPGMPQGARLLKRVIGVGGDRLSCCGPDDRLEVDGKAVTEPYLDPKESAAAGAAVEFSARVPPGSIFVAGDTRAVSNDSRFYADSPGGGAIPLSKVDGVVVAKGTLFSSEPVQPTTAFTDTGLPGESTEDTGLPNGRYLAAGGAALFLLGFIGAIVTVVRSAGRRRRAAAGPAVR